mgnify:CR=1 FL=1|tara:strand:+ start:1330 stop:1626 length:297 start_codon:yes stop_codon:yes gene_type:complete
MKNERPPEGSKKPSYPSPSKKPQNPQAFACAADDDFLQEGMTLRDYFAAKAMQGILASCANPGSGNPMLLSDHSLNNQAKHSYKLADAMLKARENQTT